MNLTPRFIGWVGLAPVRVAIDSTMPNDTHYVSPRKYVPQWWLDINVRATMPIRKKLRLNFVFITGTDKAPAKKARSYKW